MRLSSSGSAAGGPEVETSSTECVECVPVEGRLEERSVPEVEAHSLRHNDCLISRNSVPNVATGDDGMATAQRVRPAGGVTGLRVHSGSLAVSARGCTHRARTPGLPRLLSARVSLLGPRTGWPRALGLSCPDARPDLRARIRLQASTHSAPSGQAPSKLRKLPVARRQAVPVLAESGSLRPSDGNARDSPKFVRPPVTPLARARLELLRCDSGWRDCWIASWSSRKRSAGVVANRVRHSSGAPKGAGPGVAADLGAGEGYLVLVEL
jgi:hypothetical protein